MIPHPERVLFPDDGLTRAELALYYARVAPRLLPHLVGRRLTVRRWPHGIDEAGFYQKHVEAEGSQEGEGAREGSPRRPITISSAADLVRWVGWGLVEIHVPLARQDADPDWAVIDLDPTLPAGWDAVAEAAEVMFSVLDRLGYRYFVKTSGADGLHVYLPIRPAKVHAVQEHIRWLAVLISALAPDLVTVVRRVKDRGPRVYVDYLQNGPGRTMSGIYCVRARQGAPVSWPVAPRSIGALAPGRFRIRTVDPEAAPLWVWDPPNDLDAIARRHGLQDLAAGASGRHGAGEPIAFPYEGGRVHDDL